MAMKQKTQIYYKGYCE